MTTPDQKADLHRYLRTAREALLWKLDGLGEYDARRPLTPTGTNLLGLVKHLVGVELGYFGEAFDRPSDEPLARYGDEPNADMWATADEARADVVAAYRRAWAHADATIAALPLDAAGRVPWWPTERNPVTLHLVLAHVVAETQRHAGQADIVRELIDGAAGLRDGNTNLPPGVDAAWWQRYRADLQHTAETFRDT
ncbi:hypothetical protein GCM10010123_40940 [Pilimelia anulata]|uniref:DinB family protein n=1 Tax=Pilimelia anulata TaxID=53371 RepID=A0A8J3FC08_9ACTN|nr:DinB family protein [Pilimelia anulata]GGK06987.1 hypothetical protein GCM10010123_40940 [Pilimelia anulata]